MPLKIATVSSVETGSLQSNIRRKPMYSPARMISQLAVSPRQPPMLPVSSGSTSVKMPSNFAMPSGVAAVIALIHDVLITLGVFSLMDKEISLAIVAALLTIVGYSLNDTIVIFDRIRENRGRLASLSPNLINDSINQVLNRTIMTSLTTLLALIALFVLGVWLMLRAIRKARRRDENIAIDSNQIDDIMAGKPPGPPAGWDDSAPTPGPDDSRGASNADESPDSKIRGPAGQQ